jgi:hypothetical protein
MYEISPIQFPAVLCHDSEGMGVRAYRKNLPEHICIITNITTVAINSTVIHRSVEQGNSIRLGKSCEGFNTKSGLLNPHHVYKYYV